MASAPPEVLVIGVGNADRGDDGAGRAVARRLAQIGLPHVRIAEAEGEATRLLTYFEESSVVFVIDACVSGAEPGIIRRIDAHAEPLPKARYGLSSHGFGLSEALALAASLDKLPARCVVYAIEAQGFDPGAPLSPVVARAVDLLVDALRQEIDAL